MTSQGFIALGVDTDLADELAGAGIDEPFSIQLMAIPDILSGQDVCGRAKTGSGKTIAFGLPMVQMIATAKPGRPGGLILVPTRELAVQVTAVLEPLAKVRNIPLLTVYGGSPMRTQIAAIKQGCGIVVATPGRLIDLMDRKVIDLRDVEIVAIDEADQMADMGFLPQVRRIMRSVPEKHQTLLFSATLDGQVGTLVEAYMHDPVRHEVSSPTQHVDTMEHRFLKVHHMDKVKVAAEIASYQGRTLMFVRTKHACDRLARDLEQYGTRARAIHGDLHQRQREKALRQFSEGTIPVLVATNVAARGLHIDDVDVVLHYDPPDDPKTYVHRSGRTARAGESGLVVTLVEWDQVNEVLGIQRRAGLNVPIVKMFSNDERLADLSSWEPPLEMAPFGSTARRRRRL
ncbi:MAG TPA: DEAD/DEAH box helicase [Acidimicrobiia bacterium]|jgi:superfamily II DNA/RNA helicase|nr:DEAD/DEAH box helicase [Acidimicrobiia bacterium]